MHHALLHFKAITYAVDSRRIANQAFSRITYLCVIQHVITRCIIKSNTLPLSWHTIVWQIREHLIQTIATHGTVIGMQRTIYLHPSADMKVQRGITDGKMHPILHDEIAVNHYGSFRLNHRVAFNHGLFTLNGIPSPRLQIHAFFGAAFLQKHQFIGNLFRGRLTGLIWR